MIPWVTVTLPDGSPDWRACIRHRVNLCLSQRRCQLDGQHIPDTAVFFAADDQIEPGRPVITDVPPVHPECWAYAAAACPMLAGRTAGYAARPRRCTSGRNQCPDPGCGCGGWVSVDDRGDSMGGHQVESWHAVWADDWTISSPTDSGAIFAVIDRPRRIRPVPRGA